MESSNNLTPISKDTSSSIQSNADLPQSLPSSGSQSTLTPEQLDRIEQNRVRALAKLRSKKQSEQPTQDNQPNEESKLKPMKKFAKYFEYDLSTMHDTRGGFIAEEEEGEGKKRKWEPPEPEFDPPISLNPEENPKCKECGSVELDYNYLKQFNLPICPKCREAYPEKYSLITKTEAKEDYLLTDGELRDPELLPRWERPNPRKSTWNNMMLFVREQVEAYAFRRWGSAEALDAEWERRQGEKKRKKEKVFRDKLKDLRKRTFTSAWEKRQDEKHEHQFGANVTVNGVSKQVCSVCGLEVECEEF
ncbi:uncharacterized protein VTP21DRAFT_8291 [Calcarisporiella thermophila]|uniref:uncharacterized protein n=1 Tax=Calcarisporiella thermophila TaxID=911321 RepID=UPI00374441A2